MGKLTVWHVSIHAPTEGATRYPCDLQSPARVSIHAPTEGATLATKRECYAFLVSIHAPTEGATKTSILPRCTQMFQSTPPRRRRLSANQMLTQLACFNPRCVSTIVRQLATEFSVPSRCTRPLLLGNPRAGGCPGSRPSLSLAEHSTGCHPINGRDEPVWRTGQSAAGTPNRPLTGRTNPALISAQRQRRMMGAGAGGIASYDTSSATAGSSAGLELAGSGLGGLIQTAAGSFWRTGAPFTKRSGWAR